MPPVLTQSDLPNLEPINVTDLLNSEPPEILFTAPFWGRFLVFFGIECCPQCQSKDIEQVGWTYRHHRHYCNSCHKMTAISGWH